MFQDIGTQAMKPRLTMKSCSTLPVKPISSILLGTVYDYQSDFYGASSDQIDSVNNSLPSSYNLRPLMCLYGPLTANSILLMTLSGLKVTFFSTRLLDCSEAATQLETPSVKSS